MRLKISYIILFWLSFAVFMSGVMILVHPITNRPVDALGEFIWQAAFAIAWIPATSLVMMLARRFPLNRNIFLKNGIVLFFFAIVLSTIQCFAHAVAVFLMSPALISFTANNFYTSLFYNIDTMLIVFCVLVAMQHAIDYYERYREKELTTSRLEAQLTQAQMMALKMQLQPHFLFNTLNAIVALIHKDPNLAEEMTVRLSDFLRLTLEASGKQIISLREELEFIRSYLQIEEVRFGNRLQYHETVPAELLDAQLPMLMLQPLIENAIKHGISPFTHAGTLDLSVEQEDGSILISIKDDGVSGESFSIIKEGIGLSNTRQRIASLYGEEASFQIVPNKPRGVEVKIRIPFVSE